MWVAWQLALSLSLESQENCQQASFTWASLDSKTYLMGVKDGGYKPLLFFFFPPHHDPFTWNKDN